MPRELLGRSVFCQGQRDPLPGRPRVCFLQAGREDLRSRQGQDRGKVLRREGQPERRGSGSGRAGVPEAAAGAPRRTGEALLPDVTGGPCRTGASVTEGRRGPYLQTRPRRSCRRFRVVFLVNSGASCFSASKIPFGKMDISGRISEKTQNVILILDQNYRKHIPEFSGDWESVETGRFPGAGLKEK